MISDKFFGFFGTRIEFGVGETRKIGERIKSFGGQKVFICTDRGITGANLLDAMTASIEKEGLPYTVYDEVEANPALEIVEKGFELLRSNECDIIVAVGGGSSMDTAKGIAMLGTNPPPLSQYLGLDKITNPSLPLIAVPTTASTASEVTRFAVFTDKTRKLKVSTRNLNIIPELALLDPSLLGTLPPKVIAETGMDALTHAIEACLSLFGSPFTDPMGIAAIRLISENLPKFHANSGDIEAASHMLVASTLAGLAFGSAGTGVVHAMAHALGGHYNVGHGLSCGVFLPHAMAYCLKVVPDKLSRIAKAMGEKTDGLSMEETAQKSINAVKGLSRRVDIPQNFKQIGVREEDIPMLSRNAMATGIHVSTPGEIELKDMEALLREAF